MKEFVQEANKMLGKKCFKRLFKFVQETGVAAGCAYYAYMGLCYENGYGTKESVLISVTYYIKAVLAGAGADIVKSDLYKKTYTVVNSCSKEKRFEQVIGFANRSIGDKDSEELFWRNIALQYENPIAYYYLGEYYFRKGLPDCFLNFKTAYNKGIKAASSYLAQCYDKGFGVDKDENEAMLYYKIAAESGNTTSQFLYAERLFIQGNISEAQLWCRTASKNGNNIASVALALAYDKQLHFLSKDDVELFKQTSQNNHQTQYILAIICYIGRFVERHTFWAEETLKKLADEGYKKAAYALGIIKFYDILTWREDRFREYYEYMLKASNEVPEACYALGQIFNYGLETVVEPNPIKAYKYYEMAADLYVIDSMIKVGFRYLFGIYTPVDVEKAYEWLEKACDISLEPEACACLGIIFEKGLLGVCDIKAANSWYAKAIAAAQRYPNGEIEINDFIECLRTYQWDLSKLIINDLTQENEKLKALLKKATAFEEKINERINEGFLGIETTISKKIDERALCIETKVNSISRDVIEIKENTKEILNSIHDIQKTISSERAKLIPTGDFDDEEHIKFFDAIASRMNKALYQSGNANVDYEESALKGLFGTYWDKLDEFSKKALVSSRVFLSNCRSIAYGGLDYSGVCISACSALEQEIKLRFFVGYKAFLRQRFQDDYTKWPKSMRNGEFGEKTRFTIGNLPAVFGSRQRDENGKRYFNDKFKLSKYDKNLLNEYIKTIINIKGKDISVFFEQDNDGLCLLDRCEDIRCLYRNTAAHTESLSIETATACCRDVIGADKMDAAMKIGQVQGLLYDLVRLVSLPVYN